MGISWMDIFVREELIVVEVIREELGENHAEDIFMSRRCQLITPALFSSLSVQACDENEPLKKFHFIGGLDCPDWILAEIASLSKLPVLKFKNWCSSCVDCLINGRTEWNSEQLETLNGDRMLDEESLKGMLAALTFILEKTTKSGCSSRDLELEMQQLGLPAEHCKQLTKIYAANLEKLKSILLLNFVRG
uniref:Uncharacterized protein n=1 Tax=Setaria digitata TaxID=48799 RepID=A0A915Q1D5_9BILA